MNELPPPPQLAPYIKCFWLREGAGPPAGAGGAIMVDSCVELIISIPIGQSVRLAHLPQVDIIGLLDAPTFVLPAEPRRAIGARCYAWGLAPLLGTPPAQHLSLQALTVAVGDALQRNDGAGALGELQAWLVRAVAIAPAPPLDVQAGAHWLYAQRGAVRIADLADVCALSLRQLERRFLTVTGVTPKALARKIRFEQALHALWNTPHTPAAELAADFGFADQAHLVREFRALGGCTPGALVTGWCRDG